MMCFRHRFGDTLFFLSYPQFHTHETIIYVEKPWRTYILPLKIVSE